jgi:hypothetical protein
MTFREISDHVSYPYFILNVNLTGLIVQTLLRQSKAVNIHLFDYQYKRVVATGHTVSPLDALDLM